MQRKRAVPKAKPKAVVGQRRATKAKKPSAWVSKLTEFWVREQFDALQAKLEAMGQVLGGLNRFLAARDQDRAKLDALDAKLENLCVIQRHLAKEHLEEGEAEQPEPPPEGQPE